MKSTRLNRLPRICSVDVSASRLRPTTFGRNGVLFLCTRPGLDRIIWDQDVKTSCDDPSAPANKPTSLAAIAKVDLSHLRILILFVLRVQERTSTRLVKFASSTCPISQTLMRSSFAAVSFPLIHSAFSRKVANQSSSRSASSDTLCAFFSSKIFLALSSQPPAAFLTRARPMTDISCDNFVSILLCQLGIDRFHAIQLVLQPAQFILLEFEKLSTAHLGGFQCRCRQCENKL